MDQRSLIIKKTQKFKNKLRFKASLRDVYEYILQSQGKMKSLGPVSGKTFRCLYNSVMRTYEYWLMTLPKNLVSYTTIDKLYARPETMKIKSKTPGICSCKAITEQTVCSLIYYCAKCNQVVNKY